MAMNEYLITSGSGSKKYRVTTNNDAEQQRWYGLRDKLEKNGKMVWQYLPKIISLDKLEKKIGRENLKCEIKKELKDELLNELRK